MNTSGGNIQKLQVIDSSVLKTYMEQLNENIKFNNIKNKLNEPTLQQVVNDYDTYTKEPAESNLKNFYNDNLLSRIENYKHELKTKRESDVKNIAEEIIKSNYKKKTKILTSIKSVKQFINTLKDAGINKPPDGFIKDKFGRKLKIKYDDILNDFGRNSKRESFKLNDNDKSQIINFLKINMVGSNNVKNKILRDAYHDKSLISKTTPSKGSIKWSSESNNDDIPTTSGYQKSKKKKREETSWKDIKTYWNENVSDDDDD